MLRTKHNLTDDFDLMQDRVSMLKQSDPEFQRLSKVYAELDHRVRGLEMRDIPTSDEYFVGLKTQRVHLKDVLYQRLKEWDEIGS
ncbi:hypothetical protein GZ77_15865 [Endozoicomonas montiporae]|uniref:GTP-binding protein n=2 Tax=Endozoicomonas montiporae TaxID=1027273 RepID=A0A081N5P1_9GAMM|nr:DUF465 domain-containing protein [Endozoicomonas montiporae]AMO57343.1 hypothetical protein EZMO1_3348 [Endozoicomonas montiporae CL-33]KEQ13764.1 hypothetical protein GZ77_15865 [Endozoicomonas montiporae]